MSAAKVTRFFFDTEFIEDGRTIDLISIGVVSDAGREFQAVNLQCGFGAADDWVRANVLPHLPPSGEGLWMPRPMIRDGLLAFVRAHPAPWEFWAYFADYDWVVLCQLFGTMMDLPQGFPMFCLDLKQEMHRLGIEREQLPPDTREHSAIDDARWLAGAHGVLRTLVTTRERKATE